MVRLGWRETAAALVVGLLVLTACGSDNPSDSGDAVRPGPIRDLLAHTTGTTSVSLTWTAVGDDSLTGTAAAYDIRYTTSTTPRWELMTRASGESSPAEAGQPESFTVPGLTANKNYWFIVKSSDDNDQSSAESNVAVATTLASDADLGWWPGFAPHPNGVGANGGIYTFANFRNELIVGGNVTRTGPLAVLGVSAWDGESWHSLGSGINGPVIAMTPYGDRLAVGGGFGAAGGSRAMYLAFWDGSEWSSLRTELDGPVSALAVYGGDLIIGGGFTLAGSDTVNHIVRFDGSSFQPMGKGTDDWVNALTVFDGKLIAGGYFSHAGGDSAVYVATWDGTRWSPMGEGAAEPAPSTAAVLSLCEYQGALFAGGTFQSLGGAPATYLARWDGTSWISLDEINGGAFDGPGVLAMAVHGGKLYLTGRFQSIAGITCNHVASYDGSAFEPLGIGIVGQGWRIGMALADYEGSLYLGGSFNAVGNRPASGIARWDAP